MSERVYQANPATCVKVTREYLNAALVLLDGSQSSDAAAIKAEVRSALNWLPSWLEQEWDDSMAAWLDRENKRVDEATP